MQLKTWPLCSTAWQSEGMRRGVLFVFIVLAAAPIGVGQARDGVIAAYLTWRSDPARTLVVHWLSTTKSDSSALEYRRLGQPSWTTASVATMCRFHGGNEIIHHVELRGLQPASVYEFRIDRGQVRRARTAPETIGEGIRFVVGGDFSKNIHAVGLMSARVATYDPEFAILGGDIAYVEGNPDHRERWLAFLESWDAAMRRSDGTMIPLVPAIGNHEVARGGYARPKDDAPYFYSLFAFPAPLGYGHLRFGDYLSVFVLDSGHTNSVGGEQRKWLKKTLANSRSNEWKVVAYHVPAYPGKRHARSSKSRAIRDEWVPLFDQYGVDLAFEHHDHVYKRTQPLRAGALDPSGLVYFGDGGWGREQQMRIAASPGVGGVFSDRRWYLAETHSRSHFILVDLSLTSQHVQAIDTRDEILDDFFRERGADYPLEPMVVEPWYRRIEWCLVLAILGGLILHRWRTRRLRRRIVGGDDRCA